MQLMNGLKELFKMFKESAPLAVVFSKGPPFKCIIMQEKKFKSLITICTHGRMMCNTTKVLEALE